MADWPARPEQEGPISRSKGPMEPTETHLVRRADIEAELPRVHRRFYDRLRQVINARIRKRGALINKTAEWLLFLPDVFVLLFRLTRDPRVSRKNKVILGAALAYFISPLDLLPEAIVGPIGYVDDLILAAYVLNKILQDTDEAVLREHWSGERDILDIVRHLLNEADSMVESKTLAKLKRIIRG